MSNNGIQVSDICNPNMAVEFNIEDMINMINKQGTDKALTSILKTYFEMFGTDSNVLKKIFNEKFKSFKRNKKDWEYQD